MVSWLRVSLFSLILVLPGVGCKQGLNEICQVNDDCEGSLLCSPQTGLCIEPGQSPDAAPPADAPVDAPVDADDSADAMPDAMADAMADAMPDAAL
jgi:hypothetical protein